jgi:ABC-type multidrug transport system fused ATPase/permease subunit
VKKPLAYLAGLVRFALRANPGLVLCVAVGLASAVIELLAMASLLPLLSLVSGGAPTGGRLMPRLLATLSIPADAESLLWVALLLFLARIVTSLLAQTLAVHFGRRVMAQIGSTAFGRIVGHIPLAQINRQSMGHFIGLAGEEAFRASVVVIALAQFASTAALTVFYFAAIAHYSPASAALTIAFVAVGAVLGLPTAKASMRLGGRQVSESRAATSVFLDALNNLKTVRAFSAEDYVSQLYSRLLHGYSRTWFWIDEVAVLTRLVPVLLLLGVAGSWMLLSSGTFDTQGLPFMVTLIAFFLRLFPTLGVGVSLAMRIATEARSGKDLTAGLEPLPPAAAQAPIGPVRSIELDAVSFHHEGTAERPVLDGLTLRLEPGHAYALTGPSGSGKSTLADLLLRFASPTSGRILVNGQPLDSLDAGELRRRILLVGQDAAIFNDTVASNLRLGVDASDEAVQAAARAAGADEFIAAMPQGYATVIQYHGRNLSGGQRQRLAIARALLRQPDVLILDESTNALDKATQAAIIDHVLATFADRIVLLVTHDPDLVRRAHATIALAAPPPVP